MIIYEKLTEEERDNLVTALKKWSFECSTILEPQYYDIVYKERETMVGRIDARASEIFGTKVEIYHNILSDDIGINLKRILDNYQSKKSAAKVAV